MIRRGLLHIIGVVLAILCAALAAGWVRSYAHQDSFYRVTVDARGTFSLPMILSDNGRLAFSCRSQAGTPVGLVQQQGWKHMVRQHFFEFEEVRWASYHIDPPTPANATRRVEVVVRYWFLLTAALLLGLAWFRMERRYRRKPGKGACAACGYDLTGNASGVCPECGVAVRTTPAQSDVAN